MESEVNLLRRRYLDSVQSNKSMKQLIRVQKDKSRQLIVACAYKLQEKEAEIKNVRFLLLSLFYLCFEHRITRANPTKLFLP